MKTVYFHNPGELDIRGATTMGLSAKDQDDAIGKFGTGLKYAIASILRWGGAISIETGGRKYQFSTRSIEFRGKDHQQIIMHHGYENLKETELGYTTHYGSHWEPWQIFRELYSNAKDENGTAYAHRPELEGTIITVDCEKVAECYAERDTIILPSKGTKVDTESGYDAHIITAPSNFLYYRSVRVHKTKCLFTWNLMECIDLTEDRSISDTWQYMTAMGQVIQASNDEEFIAKCLRAKDNHFESNASYSTWQETSKEFISAATWLYKQEGRKALPSGVWEILCKHTPEVDAPELVQLTKVQQKQLDRAIELVARMGLDSSVPIHVVKLQKNVLGQAKNGQVYLSPQVFEQGTKQIVSTLFEECLHLETGLKDCTYEMQTRLFNMIVSLYEEHVFGEAC